MTRAVALLVACQALMMTCQSILVASTALVGFLLAPDKALATLPVGSQFLATMLTTYPASWLMGQRGRRFGFLIGAVLAISGAACATYAIWISNFWLFCLGTFLIGTFNAFGQYYRFAAADCASVEFRSRAISLVLGGGVVAGFVGPNLAAHTQMAIPSAVFAGTFAALLALYLVNILVIAFLDIPHEAPSGDTAPTPVLTLARRPKYFVAVFSAITAYASMSLVMTATPLAMDAYGFDFPATAVVIQWHIVGMFAPAFVTGHLIHRFGVLTVMGWGAILLGASCLFSLLGQHMSHFFTALLILGVGWNFLFTGATTLLTESYRPSEKARAQGLNDLLVFTMVTLTAFSAGYLHLRIGWSNINAAVFPLTVVSFALLLWLHRQPREAAFAS